jgi:protein arginine kinase
MSLVDLIPHAGEWLRGEGPMQDVVVSSRVRLARNLAGVPFLSRCGGDQQRQLADRLSEKILAAPLGEDMFYVDLETASPLDRQILVERHLISRQHADADHPRGVAASGNERVAIMTCEEDHLRIQVLRSALQLVDAVEEIGRIDDTLEESLDFAFHSRYGYLTACPTNAGTGMRVSVMLHLPALKMSGQIEQAFRAARDMRLAVRGLYGEGTEAHGDFFQVSNQTTLGKSEDQIVREFLDSTVPQFVQYERRAREGLMKSNAAALEDKALRSIALLRSARIMGSEEAMYLLSLVRLGVSLGILTDIQPRVVNELFLLTQPAHLQRICGKEMEPSERGAARAEYVRRRLQAG